MENKDVKIGRRGKCPHCQEEVQGELEKEGSIGRDTYRCPNCGERMLYCFNPSCNDYTKYGTVINHDLCPACTSGVISTLKEVGICAASTIIAAFVGKKIK